MFSLKIGLRAFLEVSPEFEPHEGIRRKVANPIMLSGSWDTTRVVWKKHSLQSFSGRHDQWEAWERVARAYHPAMLWQRVPSAMLCLLRDGSVTVWLDWHSVKWGFLRALTRKDLSQQHFKHSASAKLSEDFNSAHLFCMDMTTYYRDIHLFDTEEKYKQTNVCNAAACLLT